MYSWYNAKSRGQEKKEPDAITCSIQRVTGVTCRYIIVEW